MFALKLWGSGWGTKMSAMYEGGEFQILGQCGAAHTLAAL